MLNVYINGKNIGVGDIAVENQVCMLTLRTEVTLEIEASPPSHRQNCSYWGLFR